MSQPALQREHAVGGLLSRYPSLIKNGLCRLYAACNFLGCGALNVQAKLHARLL